MNSDRGNPGRLHVITDVTLQQRFSHAELGGIAARAGADVVQYRDKRGLSFEAHCHAAAALRAALEGAALVVDDRVEVARFVAAAGVHLGRGDMPVPTARGRLGPRCWIGVTANSLDEARAADHDEVDYLGVGPVFGTRSKAAPAARLGLDALRAIVRAVGRPVVAIGGIDPSNVAAVLETGAHGVAVLSCVACSADPAAVVSELRARIDRSIAALEPAGAAEWSR